MTEKAKKWLIIEPFYGGSHQSMITCLLKDVPPEKYTLITMSAKKWHWRARCSSLYVYTQLPNDLENYTTLFASSVLPLADLVGMCPKLEKLKKVLYFHENQLIYPKRVVRDRDFQFGFNQITSCIAADVILFNSQFNKSSFISNINKFLNLMPDYKVHSMPEIIEKKSQVIYFPMDFSAIDDLYNKQKQSCPEKRHDKPLCIAWPHRWEHDKNAKLMFDALYELHRLGVPFEVVILGESFSEISSEFLQAKENLRDHIKHFGYAASVELYWELLMKSDIVLSTADHEFFGVSMLEGVRLGCVPIAPNKLVYPELYPKKCLYNSQKELVEMLKEFCTDTKSFTDFKKEFNMDTDQFNAKNVLQKLIAILDS